MGITLPLKLRGEIKTNMAPAPRSALEQKFLDRWTELRGAPLREQYLFHVPREGERQRQWRFDFAHVASRTAVEIDGGAFTQGRHTRGRGFEQDMEKLNTAQEQGWHVFRLTERLIDQGWAERIIADIVRREGTVNQ